MNVFLSTPPHAPRRVHDCPEPCMIQDVASSSEEGNKEEVQEHIKHCLTTPEPYITSLVYWFTSCKRDVNF